MWVSPNAICTIASHGRFMVSCPITEHLPERLYILFGEQPWTLKSGQTFFQSFGGEIAQEIK
jgi:hypothetical protein